MFRFKASYTEQESEKAALLSIDYSFQSMSTREPFEDGGLYPVWFPKATLIVEGSGQFKKYVGCNSAGMVSEKEKHIAKECGHACVRINGGWE